MKNFVCQLILIIQLYLAFLLYGASISVNNTPTNNDDYELNDVDVREDYKGYIGEEIEDAWRDINSRRAKLQVAFGIMVYQKPGQTPEKTLAMFYQLMDEIYDAENHIYVIHVDIKSDKQVIHAINDNFCANLDNCESIKPRNVGWAGMTTGEMMLALMQTAYEFSDDWEYFANLGHESAPLTSLDYIEDFLSTYPRGTNFINCWKIDGYDFFGQWEDNFYRLQDIVVEDFNGGLLENVGFKRQPPSDLNFYKSIQLMVLSRMFVKYVIYGIDTRRVMLYLANVKTSDEMLIPTLLQLEPKFAKTATCDTTLHFTHWIRPGGSWHPEYLSLEHLPQLLNTSKHLFARKVDYFDLNQVGISHHLTIALRKIRELGYHVYKTDSEVHAEETSLLLTQLPSPSSYDNKPRPIMLRPAFVARHMRWIVPLGVQYFMNLQHKASLQFDESRDADSPILEALRNDQYFGFERTDLSVVNNLFNNTRVPYIHLVNYSLFCDDWGNYLIENTLQIVNSSHDDELYEYCSSIILPMDMLLLLNEMRVLRDSIEVSKVIKVHEIHSEWRRAHEVSQSYDDNEMFYGDDSEDEYEDEDQYSK